ncbi:major facilitator superfamily domain-containing protein [Cercophora scortea]|uniref:Major facilitator superfamily domain-containing protein n=1 Tax=Cercophora scortea TaxID=314031 RepID=A0AAE0M923_9PEZI|nr:major facilitator superfamily domain-containing protein [Cercophora scortea]
MTAKSPSDDDGDGGSGSGSGPDPDPGPDPESLSRVSSGPAYSAFSKSMKRWIVAMATLASFVSPMSANIYFPVLNPLAAQLGVSVGLINLTLTTYMVFQALSPPVLGDFGDMAGRRPAFIICFVIYILANLGLALQSNYAALLVLRMLQSAGSSGTLALCFAVVADVSVSAERGKYMAIMGAGINIGPALSPVIGGVLSQYMGWRSVFWFCLIYSGAWLVPFVLFIPETCRNVVGNGSIPPQNWMNMTLIDYIRARRHPPTEKSTAPERKLRWPNPLSALKAVLEKDMSLLFFYNTLIYLAFILIIVTLSTQFAEIYHYNELQIGLCYLPFGLGCCGAVALQGRILDWNYRRTARKIGFTIDYRRGDDLSKFPIEKARIQPVVPMLAVGVAATIAYGWVLQAETNLAGPLVLVFIIGLCVSGSFSVLNTLIVDLYPDAPATAMAANNLVRCVFGAGCTAGIEYMLKAFGRGWTYTFWALLLVVFSPILWILTTRGPGWREERRAKKLQAKANKEARRSVSSG